MSPEEDVIRSRYAQRPTDELIQLYKDGDLVEEVIPILVEEIKRRGYPAKMKCVNTQLKEKRLLQERKPQLGLQ
jgi:hypothetical protein